jgi:tetratricopeptide (TPR) repeat protein
VFRRVSTDVYEGTKRAQLPELSLSLIGEFYLRGRPTFAAPAPLSTTEPKPSEAPAAVEAPTKQARLSEPADPFRRDLVTDCDRLAASPDDSKRANGVAGIHPKKIDIVSARTACNDAMRQYPEVSRFIFQAGRVATAQQDYATALSHYRKAIAMGNIPSMTSLGLAHDAGLGVAQDQSEARRWYKKAAALGDAEAMLFLANMAEHGHGTSKDLAEARRWYEKAADAGSTDAQASLKRLSKRR